MSISVDLYRGRSFPADSESLTGLLMFLNVARAGIFYDFSLVDIIPIFQHFRVGGLSFHITFSTSAVNRELTVRLSDLNQDYDYVQSLHCANS